MGLMLRLGLMLPWMLRLVSPPRLRRVPVPRLLGLLLLWWRRPARRAPAGRGTVVGLPGSAGTVLRVLATGLW